MAIAVNPFLYITDNNDFTWNNDLHVISEESIIQPIENGGLQMVKTYYIVNAAKSNVDKKVKNLQRSQMDNITRGPNGYQSGTTCVKAFFGKSPYLS